MSKDKQQNPIDEGFEQFSDDMVVRGVHTDEDTGESTEIGMIALNDGNIDAFSAWMDEQFKKAKKK